MKQSHLCLIALTSFPILLSQVSLAQADSVVHITKRSGQDYAIDGNQGAANGQSVYLWNQSTNNVNQRWIEINRGGGYYSYQKQGTDHCLDGGNGGANRQDVYLWSCSGTNQNQQWFKSSTDSGFVKLIKRNSSGFALDGGTGGSNGQNVNLYDSSNSSHNLQWRVEVMGEIASTPVNGDLISHNFNNGNLAPFEPCTVASPNYSRVINGRVKTYWTEDGYRNNRTTRGAEFCEVGRGDGEDQELRFHKEGWMGFSMNVHEDNTRNTDYAVTQVMGYRNWDNENRFNSWSFLMNLDNGDLTIDYRRGAGNPTTATVVRNFTQGVDHDFIINFVNSNESKGKLEIWINGHRAYSANNINLGMGDFNNQDEQDFGSHSAFKLGMYNYNSDEYIDGEERTVYYDNVSWYSGSNGYDLVDPG